MSTRAAMFVVLVFIFVVGAVAYFAMGGSGNEAAPPAPTPQAGATSPP